MEPIQSSSYSHTRVRESVCVVMGATAAISACENASEWPILLACLVCRSLRLYCTLGERSKLSVPPQPLARAR